ncbi:hypothetical protein BASA81_002327 [Batrachochytrium salamandrivorans]|nr:hypothetical protein BASA81_002327 [Batrachochytrium salamandrivorans]
MERASKRKAQAEEYEMVRELIRVEVLVGVENLVNAEWAPNRTLVISFSLESTLLESWSIRYSPSQQLQDLAASSTPMLETRYLASTLLVRQLIVVAEALPATRNAATEYTSMFVETGDEAPLAAFLSEEVALPAVNMAFGKVFIQVRYRAEAVPRTRRLTSPEPQLQQEDLESSGGGAGQQHLSARIMEDYIANKMEDAVGGGEENEGEDDDDGDAGDQRWKRWTLDTFTARERELQREEEDEEEEEAQPVIPPPPELARQSSSPMNIKPTPLASTIRKRSGMGRGTSFDAHLRKSPVFSSSSLSRTGSSAPQISRKLSNTGVVRKRLGSFRVSSEGEDQPVGDVTDLMGTPPNASSLPHLLGSLAGSANSGDRTRFLSTNSPVFLSAGSLMIYNKTEVASTTPPTTPTPLAVQETTTTLSLLATSTHAALAAGAGAGSKSGLYESALPWILTAAEMERPFSGLSGSIFLGTALDSRVAKQLTNPVGAATEAVGGGDDEEEESDNFALPFEVAGDEEDSFAQRHLPLPLQSKAEDELGAFLLRCRQAPSIFDNEPVVQLLGVRKEFELLAAAAAASSTVAAAADAKPSKSSEIITQVDKQ